MYWLRSSFGITNKECIEQLAQLYRGVKGELEFCCETIQLKIQWTNNPFESLLKILEKSNVFCNGCICCRMCGPDTLRAVAFQPTKIPQVNFEHPEKHILLQWADFIDQSVESEMRRTNDLNWSFKPPATMLQTYHELLLAVRLSKFATHIIPIEKGFLVVNDNSVYWSDVFLSYEKSKETPTSFYFDKDDGFGSPFCSPNSDQIIRYLNERYFNPWKENGSKGSLFPNLEE